MKKLTEKRKQDIKKVTKKNNQTVESGKSVESCRGRERRKERKAYDEEKEEGKN